MTYRNYGRLDTPILVDGDRGFRAIDSYLEPSTLQGGVVQTSENMLGWRYCRSEKRHRVQSRSVSLTHSGTDRVFTSTTFSDPVTGQEFIASATRNS